VPGDRTISWPRLRELLGISRMSMPDACDALEATGYERGTITPFGSTTAWPVVADERLSARRSPRRRGPRASRGASTPTRR
jgi:prolyl-tRNA editing enzyme YbaK/EbsC (Cys-tRNA(Pro) deacylase)